MVSQVQLPRPQRGNAYVILLGTARHPTVWGTAYLRRRSLRSLCRRLYNVGLSAQCTARRPTACVPSLRRRSQVRQPILFTLLLFTEKAVICHLSLRSLRISAGSTPLEKCSAFQTRKRTALIHCSLFTEKLFTDTSYSKPPPRRVLRRRFLCLQLPCRLGRKVRYRYFRPLAACSVFCISIQMVMGPTPPGTGVMAAHLGATAS